MRDLPAFVRRAGCRTSFAAVLVVASLLSGCYSVPVTGRSSLALVSEEAVIKQAADAFAEVKATEPISQDPRLNAMVQRVGQRIADAALFDVPSAEWEFVLFDDPGSINAFAMPGGKVGVYTGLFQVVKTDADLAVVLGHEVAHVSARHASERLSQQAAIQAGGVGLAVVVGQSVPQVSTGTILDLYGLGTTLGVALPYNRKMEIEADEIGLMYMARAGYDPSVALDFWERMELATAGEGRPPEFLSTHPEPGSRQARLREVLPRAQEEYRIAARP